MALDHLQFTAVDRQLAARLQLPWVMQPVTQHDLALGDQVQQRFLRVAVSLRNLTPGPGQNDGLFLLGPLDFLGDNRQQVIDDDDRRLGQSVDVLLRHRPRRRSFGVECRDVLVLGQHDDVEAQPLGDFPHLVVELFSGVLDLLFPLGHQPLRFGFPLGHQFL